MIPRKPTISHELTLVTPEHAKELLEINTNNRRINQAKVSQYARDMANNDFDYNGHTICISNTNVLLDGQQRLTACVKSNTPFWTILVKDLDESVVATIDSGRSRSYSDRLKMRGYNNASALAATVVHVALIAANNPKNCGFSPSQMDAVLDANPDIVESVAYARNTYTKCDPLLGAIHYVAKQTGYDAQADQFIESWKDGQKNYEYDPIHYVREMLTRDAHKLKKMTTVVKSRLILLSWNKFKSFEPLRNARITKHEYSMDGWTVEKANLVI